MTTRMKVRSEENNVNMPSVYTTCNIINTGHGVAHTLGYVTENVQGFNVTFTHSRRITLYITLITAITY